MRNHYKNHSNKAFTLLEMSVVVVIIGLLLGAITGVRNFNKNAELNSIVSEAKYYIYAFQQFGQLKNSYHMLPGDFSQASAVWNGAYNGDGNGFVRVGTTVNNSELFNTFQHLSRAGMIRGNFPGQDPGVNTRVAIVGNNVPGSVISGAGYFFDHPNAMNGNVNADTLYFNGKYGHVLRMGKETANDMPVTPVLSPVDAAKIDDKFDDGLPGQGWITVNKPTGTASVASPQCAADASTYFTTASGELCTLIYNIQ